MFRPIFGHHQGNLSYTTLGITVDFTFVSYVSRGPGSSVGIATDYGLDGPGIESRWGARFSAPVQTGPGAQPASCTMGTGSFPVRPGRAADHSPPSSTVVLEE